MDAVEVQDRIRRAYARLVGLSGNIPEGFIYVDLKFADEFNKALDHLTEIGADLSEFRITQADWTDTQYERKVARSLLKSRVEAVLTYFQISEEPSELPSKRIGFEGPIKS